MPEVYVAAGSNIDPQENLRRALARLAGRYGPLRKSRAYLNAPVGFDGASFVNLVFGFDSDDSVEEVLAQLHGAEAACGRPRNAPKWGPRAMDLDVLLYGDLVTERPGLTLPRPDLVRKAYMLGPLAEIAPQVVHPTLGKTIGELWEAFDQQAHPMEPVELDP
jgi:2-amino-4-hydroxy-6-hydroxymethyldihydropteridine diphosphokinase